MQVKTGMVKAWLAVGSVEIITWDQTTLSPIEYLILHAVGYPMTD